jgi:hypothetical protein
MTDTPKTRHERMKHHLRNATKHLAEQARLAQEGAAAHLVANPVVPPAATTTDGPTSEESSPNDAA